MDVATALVQEADQCHTELVGHLDREAGRCADCDEHGCARHHELLCELEAGPTADDRVTGAVFGWLWDVGFVRDRFGWTKHTVTMGLGCGPQYGDVFCGLETIDVE